MLASLKPLDYNDPSGNAIHDLKYWTNVRFTFAHSSVGCQGEKTQGRGRSAVHGGPGGLWRCSGHSIPTRMSQRLQYGGALGVPMGPSGTSVALILRLPVHLSVLELGGHSFSLGRQESESRGWVLSPGQLAMVEPFSTSHHITA